MDSKNTEFDPYLSSYGDYDLINKSISSVKDLDAAAAEFFMSPKQNTMASPANTSLLFHNADAMQKSPIAERNNGLGLSLANPLGFKTAMETTDYTMGQMPDMLDISQFTMVPPSAFGVSEDLSQMTVTPATLAKYSKMLNMNNVPHQPNLAATSASPHRSSHSPARPPQSPTKVVKTSPFKHRRGRHGGSLNNIDATTLISTDIHLPPSTPSSHNQGIASPSQAIGGVYVPSSPIASPYHTGADTSGLASVTASPQHRPVQRGHKSRLSTSVLLMPLENGEEPEADQLRQRLTLHSQELDQQELYNTSPKPGFSPTLDHFDDTPEAASVPQFLSVVTPNPGSLEMFANGAHATDMLHPVMAPPVSPTKPHKSPSSQNYLLGQGPQLYHPVLGGVPPQMALITPQQQLMLQQQHQQQQLSPEHFQQIYALEQAAALGGHSQVFQVLNGAIVAAGHPGDGSEAIAWQPVVTAPLNHSSEEIIKTQQIPIVHPSNRKSCLPPGKVDSYLSGPNEEGQFICLFPNCGKFFKRRYNVRSHIQTHLCDRPYLCEICQATFVRPHDLRRHEKCHQDEKPFKCPCSKTFTRHDALQRHRSRMICVGGIEIPGKPKKPPGKRGRPRKNPDPNTGSAASKQDEDQDQDEMSSTPDSSADATPMGLSDIAFDEEDGDENEHLESDFGSYVNSTSGNAGNSNTELLSLDPSATMKKDQNKALPLKGSKNGLDADSESDQFSPYTASPEAIVDPSLLQHSEPQGRKGKGADNGVGSVGTFASGSAADGEMDDSNVIVDPMFWNEY